MEMYGQSFLVSNAAAGEGVGLLTSVTLTTLSRKAADELASKSHTPTFCISETLNLGHSLIDATRAIMTAHEGAKKNKETSGSIFCASVKTRRIIPMRYASKTSPVIWNKNPLNTNSTSPNDAMTTPITMTRMFKQIPIDGVIWLNVQLAKSMTAGPSP